MLCYAMPAQEPLNVVVTLQGLEGLDILLYIACTDIAH